MISHFEKFLKPDTQSTTSSDLARAPRRAKPSRSQATPGFSLASGAAIKLLVALWHLAAAGRSRGSHDEIGVLTGLTRLAVARALKELQALDWVRAISGKDIGIDFILPEPPATFSPRAAQRVATRIATTRKRPDAQG